MNRELERAVAYYRMSTDEQEKSIDDQRNEVVKFARNNGFVILREYSDPGISGDDTKKRLAFRQMVCDATSKADFNVILCWALDRFGRFDALEAGYWIWPLREQGVRLVTVSHGLVDWEEFSGRLMFAIAQEGKHQFLRDLSRDSLRGRIASVKAGNSCGASPPLGYDRMEVDANGAHVRRLTYGEWPPKGLGHRVRFVPSSDPELVGFIRWLFEEYGNGRATINELVRTMKEKGIPTYGGKQPHPWTRYNLIALFSKSLYCGDRVFGQFPHGRYHYFAAGEILSVSSKHNHEVRKVAPMLVENVCEALVSRDLWNLVAERLRVERGAYRERRKDWYLAGLVFCEHCGRRMTCSSRLGMKTYECTRSEARARVVCVNARHHERPLLAFVRRVLLDYTLTPELLKRQKASIRRQVTLAIQADAFVRKSLVTRLETIGRLLERAGNRLLMVSAGAVPTAQSRVAALAEERQRVDARLLRIGDEPAPNTSVDRIIDRLSALHRQIQGDDPTPANLAMRELIDRITLRSGCVQHGKRFFKPFESGTVYVKVQARPDLQTGMWTASQVREVHFTAADLAG